MRKKRKHTSIPAVLLMMTAILAAGALTGAFWGTMLSEQSSFQIFTYINDYLNTIQHLDMNYSYIFLDCLFKYGKYIILLWVLAFIPKGAYANFLVLFFRGIGYGFTTSILILSYGAKGLFWAFCLYVPQNIIMAPLMIYTAYISFCFMLSDKPKQAIITEYSFTLLISFACVILTSLLETIITPFLAGIIL